MNPQEISLFVKSQLEKGVSQDKIGEILKTNQVSPEQIAAAFAEITPAPVQPTTSRPVNPNPVPVNQPPVSPAASMSFIPIMPRPTNTVPPTPPSPRPTPTPPPIYTNTVVPKKSHGGLTFLTILILLLIITGGTIYFLGKPATIAPITPETAPVTIKVTPTPSQPTPVAIPVVATNPPPAETVTATATTPTPPTNNPPASSSVLAQLQSIQELATAYQTAKGSYLGLCQSPEVSAILVQLKDSAVTCHVGTIGKSYGLTAKEASGQYVCVDSTGATGNATGALPVGATACSTVK